MDTHHGKVYFVLTSTLYLWHGLRMDTTTAFAVRMLRIARLSLAARTTLAAAAWCAIVLLRASWESRGSAMQLAAAGLVISIGLLTWLSLRVAASGMLLLAGGLLLVILGSAALIWSIHVGLTTTDFEYWAMLFHLLIGSQGVTIVLGLHLEAIARSPARPLPRRSLMPHRTGS